MKRTKFGTLRVTSAGRFNARYPLNGKQVSAGTFDTETDARHRLDEIEVDLRRGVHWDDRKGKVKVKQFMTEYMVHRKNLVSEGEYRNNQSYLRRHILPAFGDWRIEDLDEEALDMWWVAQPPTETRRNVYAFLRKAMRTAVKWRYIRTSPCQVEQPSKAVGEPRPTWTVADYKKVLALTPERFHAPLEVLFAGHLRLGELIGLNASDYDRRTGRISVTKQFTNLGHMTDTKTGQHKNIELLTNGVAAMESELPAFGSMPLFRGVKGGRLPRASLQKAWNRAVADAGFENFHVHDVRHVSLSLLQEAGVPPRDIQYRGGHASAMSTFRYQHTDASRDAAAAAATNVLLANLG